MIGVIFSFGAEYVEVRIDGVNCFFTKNQNGVAMQSSIDGLKLDYAGTIKEFPDLKDKTDWREEAIKRFKEKIKSYNTEEERIDYIINDLKKSGYIPLYKQKEGFRVEKFK